VLVFLFSIIDVLWYVLLEAGFRFKEGISTSQVAQPKLSANQSATIHKVKSTLVTFLIGCSGEAGSPHLFTISVDPPTESSALSYYVIRLFSSSNHGAFKSLRSVSTFVLCSTDGRSSFKLQASSLMADELLLLLLLLLLGTEYSVLPISMESSWFFDVAVSVLKHVEYNE
jgi:hypothetical protein